MHNKVELPTAPVDASTRPTTGAPAPIATANSTWRLPAGWAWFAALVGPVVATICLALEPAPANPNAPEPLIGVVLGNALLLAWVGAAVAAGRRRSSALSWAVGVGALSLAMTISCPLSGHHTSIGMWWVGEFVVSGAAFAAALVGQHQLRQHA
jgi:hypothetical protein